ncbi:hypothetical protein CBR_g4315 [Chara braunii]|uniref:CCHC-type domain-containing protein n=1 Tax=Chara braunii TaxID=69332 RepID=A0A388JRF6_CHABU|nr:hypothetical protein CBR_g4315 [Chara braunii]|eukprot:GBG60357.1 hypothetical protein CBR_g4315 [Chara braunii]
MGGITGTHIGGAGGVGGISPPINPAAAQYGVVTCFICGKNGHYAQNCWHAANKLKPEEENSEMRELLQRIARREKEEEEKKKRKIEEARKKEEDERRESAKMREEEAREDRLESTIIRILEQKNEACMLALAPPAGAELRKRSLRSKARILREIRSYIAKSDDNSEEVKDEADKLIEALESRKKGKKSAATTVALYRTAGLFSRNTTRSWLHSKLARVIKDRFGMDVRRRVIVKIPFSALVDISAVRDVTVKVITIVVQDEAIRSLVIERLRITRLKGKTVGAIIHNYKKKLVAKEEGCTCALRDLSRFQGHVRVRLDEVPGVHRFVLNSRNVTSGRTMTKTQLLEKIVQAIPKWWRASLLQLKNKEVQRCFRMNGVPAALSEQQVEREVRHIRDLVLVPLARNPGATLVICPVLYFHAFRMTFTWNPAFRRLKEDEAEVLAASKAEYKTAGLQATATWRTCGKLGRAYVIPKDKDFSRWRPILPSWSEPSRTASGRLGRVLRYMLLGVSKTSRFSLKSTDGMTQALTTATKRLSRYGDTVVGRCYDIKDMFAKLPHGDITSAVAWLIKMYEDRRLVAAKVSVRGKLCKMSKTLRREDGYVCLPFGRILKLVSYELCNTFTVCEGRVFQQKFGIPMAKHSSPALADVLCSRAEYALLMSLGNDRRAIAGVRMVDDVSVLVAYDADEAVSHENTLRVFYQFERCYPETLNLVRKDEGTNAWEFLGARVVVEPDRAPVHIFSRTNNHAYVDNQPGLHFHSMQDYQSYSAKKVKKMTLTASMLRLWRTATDEDAALAAILCLVKEARLRDYPLEVFFASLARFAKVVGGPGRSLILQVYPHHKLYIN